MTKEEIIQKVNFPVGELENVFANNGNNVSLLIPDRKAIYRSDTNKVLGLLSNKYKILPHSQVVETIFNSLDNEKVDYQPKNIEVLNNGGKLFLHLILPEVYQVGELGDDIQMEIIASNSYDGSTSFGIELGGYRLVCSNGMRAWHKDIAIAKRHYISEPRQFIQQFFTKLKQFKDEVIPFFNSCAKLGIKKSEGVELISNLVIAEKYKRKAAQEWMNESEKSLWSLYNVLTYVAAHIVKSYMVSRDLQLRAVQMARARLEG
jgi:hypothetical protein